MTTKVIVGTLYNVFKIKTQLSTYLGVLEIHFKDK